MRRYGPLLLLAALLLTACTTASGAETAAGPVSTAPSPTGAYRGLELDPPQPRPAFTLTDTAGRKVDFGAATRGAPTFLFFGYTSCPDICPTTMADLAAALRTVPAGERSDVRVVFVTTDPATDTGARLQQWLHNFDPGLPPFTGLRGTEAEVAAAQAAARVPIAEDHGRTHSSQLFLYGRDDYARVMYLAGSSPDDIRHDLPAVVRR